MEQKNIALIVTGFVTLLIGILLISTVATQGNAVTEKTIVLDETKTFTSTCLAPQGGGQINESDADCNYTVTNYPSGWKITDCPLTSVVVSNATRAFTLNTDYRVFASTGIIQMLNSTSTDAGAANTTLVDYAYCSDGYMNQTWGRTAIDLVAGFFAIALLLVSVGLFYQVLKNEGLTGI